MSLVWRLAWRDLRGGIAGLRLLAICLFLGVASLAAVGSLSAAIVTELAARGQSILGGDLELRVSQRTAFPGEAEAMRAMGAVSETIRMRAMAARLDGRDSVLAELKGVDAAYPLYGDLRLAPGALAARPHGREVAIAPAFAERLNLKVGDSVRFGDASLRIVGLIAEEPDRVGEGFTLGPVALVDSEGLAATGLVQPGSLYSARYRIRMAGDPAKAGDAFAARFRDGGWDVRDRSNAARGTRRFIEQLGEFLSLVGLTALMVSGIGVGNGVASYLDTKRGGIATLKALGAGSGLIARLYLLEVMLVAVAGILAGLVAGALAPAAIVALAGSALPVAPKLALYPLPLAVSAAFGLLVAFGFALIPLARARSVAAASLFRGGVEAAKRPSFRVILAVLAVVALLAALAIGTARDPLFAASFLGVAVALLLFLALIGWGVRALAARLPRPRRPLLRLALTNLHRPGAQTDRLVVALGLGLTLFASMAVIETNLSGQIASTIPKKAPTFFALDVPVTDIARFRDIVAKDAPGANLVTVPSLRGPVVAINGKRVADMKDIPPGAWVLRGDRGLTYAKVLPAGSAVVAGKWWPADYAGPPLVSLDVDAATALGLKIGDTLTVSVLGVDIDARLASFRKIDWQSMGFNFAIIFSPGVLEGAPHSYMATISVPPGREASLQRAVTQGFPSVSMIRVKDVITQVSTLLEQLAAAVRAAATVALAAGVAVLTGAIAASRRKRIYDAVVLKLLGATRAQILGAQAIEYAGLAALLSVLALALGGAGGWYVVTRIFKLAWAPDWPTVIGTVVAGALVVLVLGLLGSLPALAARPAQTLRTL